MTHYKTRKTYTSELINRITNELDNTTTVYYNVEDISWLFCYETGAFTTVEDIYNIRYILKNKGYFTSLEQHNYMDWGYLGRDPTYDVILRISHRKYNCFEKLYKTIISE
jgi:hypothetical protein